MAEHTPTDTHLPETLALNDMNSLRFEKSELSFFVEDDRDAGAKIGKLLAAIFCILVVLMSIVVWWTNHNEFASQDPFAAPAAPSSSAGH